MDKILISSCFLGDLVRYDGQEKTFSHQLIIQWKNEGRFIAICPEVSGGLTVPRAPAEITAKNSNVITNEGIDVTLQFEKGAQQALALCKKFHLKYALLKENSPSCGSTFIYDGSFNNQKTKGKGITTRLLENEGIKVFSEDSIDDLAKYIK